MHFCKGLEEYDVIRLPEDFRRHSYDDFRSNLHSESYDDVRVPTRARSIQQIRIEPYATSEQVESIQHPSELQISAKDIASDYLTPQSSQNHPNQEQTPHDPNITGASSVGSRAGTDENNDGYETPIHQTPNKYLHLKDIN